MSLESLVILALIGAVAGWLAGLIVKGYGFGLIANMLIGVAGAFIGDFLMGKFNVHIASGISGTLINATIGAVFLLFIIGLIRKVT